jgi:FkbM family methyltransferase
VTLPYEDANMLNVGVKTTMWERTVECRHGTFTVFDEDELVGLSLVTYGEYSEGEVEVFRKVLKPGDVAIDVGANIGALTIPMAKLVADEHGLGHVYAFEPSGANYSLLMHNIDQNGLGSKVIVIPHAASDKRGKLKVDKQSALHAYSRRDINEGEFEVECSTIDDLQLSSCKLIKIDVDGHELEVLNGAVETIKRCKPIIYIENEIDQKREALVAWFIDHSYRCFWHRPYLFNIDNWRGDKTNIFGALVSIMNVCVPDEEGYEVLALEEVSDYRDDFYMFEREIERYLKYVNRNPDDLQSRWMAAHYSNLMQWRGAARSLIENNLMRDPEHVPTRALEALMNLQDGHYSREGWAGYEIRHKQPNRHQFGGDRSFNVPRWDGEKTDKPLLIWSEQGFGDNIMFVRFFKRVLERAPNAFLECRPELFELFEYSEVVGSKPLMLPHTVRGRWPRLYRLGRSMPYYELQLPLPSTAWALGADADMIRVDGRYLDVDAVLVDNWLGQGNIRLGQTPEGPLHGARIGLCHKGSHTSERPYTRDIPKELLMPLVRKFGPVFPLDQQGQFDSFAMTAAAIKALDFVITVDTSIAHLAGALGVPTWLLLSYDPDFRWGLTGNRTIWYPSIRIFRQPKFRDWSSVIEEVMAELETWSTD